MHKISNSNLDPDHLALLKDWFISEWGEVDPFDSSNEGVKTPSPVLATENGELLGGLSFCWARKPHAAELGVWINAVLISPEYRGLGLASKLVQAAESEAARKGMKELFVYSEFPKMYEKLGWQIQGGDSASKVLWKSIAKK